MVIGGRLRRARRASEEVDGVPQAFPPGAFYSPVVNAAEIMREPDHSRVWPDDVPDPPGIDIRAGAQLALLEELAAYRFAPTSDAPEPRYDPANDQFPPQDAALLYAMVRHLAPRRMIEVGSGWSTIVTATALREGALDTQLTCIEPYPRDFLHSIDAIHQLREEKVEHTPLALFEALESGDVLFIDSSHVVKTGSDVVHQLLEVVPRLADGVVVHVHDIFLPADYPQPWVRAGFNWTEQYLLQAFLIGNAHATVLAMNHWLALRHPDAVRDAFGPVDLNGSSVWFVTGSAPGTMR